MQMQPWNWNLSLANENKKDHRRHGGPLSVKIYKQWEPREEEQRELPVIVAGGKNLSPYV